MFDNFSVKLEGNIGSRGSSVVWWLFDNTTPHWPKSHHTTLRWIAKLGIFRQKVAHFGDFWHKSGDFRFYCISRKIRAFGANWHFSVVFSVVWWLFDHTSVVWCCFKKSPLNWILYSAKSIIFVPSLWAVIKSKVAKRCFWSAGRSPILSDSSN